jgi:hypothetical protein
MDAAEYLSYDALGLAELVAAREVSAAELLALARGEPRWSIPASTRSFARCVPRPTREPPGR